MKIRKSILFILTVLLCINFLSCKKKPAEEGNKEKTLNLYIDIKDKSALEIIKLLTEAYTKQNPQSKLKINDVLGGENNIVEDVSKGEKADILLCSRNTMVELSKKGLLSDMSQYYEKNKVSEKFYNIISAYGRVEDKYYGIGIIPHTIEVFYNTDSVSKLGAKSPENVIDLLSLLKKISGKGIRIPVIVPEDLDINIALSSVIGSNRLKFTALDKAYDNKNSYKDLKVMQYVFDDINIAAKEGGISKNSFELGNESTLTSLTNGSIPVVIGNSYYYKNLKEGNIDTVDELTLDNKMKANIPVIVNTLLCVPTNGKNTEEVGKFIKYVLSDETQESLVKKGYISGNKKANAELQGIGEKIVKHLSNANENSILYIYGIPKKFNKPISGKIDSILAGKYSGKEWEEILNEIYK